MRATIDALIDTAQVPVRVAARALAAQPAWHNHVHHSPGGGSSPYCALGCGATTGRTEGDPRQTVHLTLSV